MTEKKILIAYYSFSGNTKKAALEIQKITNGDLFEIIPSSAYPNSYNDVVNQAKKEKETKYCPELINNIDISGYDVIFLGTPVWWYTFASPIRTFLSKNNFSNKTIIPFCTHGGGGASSTYSDMKELAQNAIFKNGYTSYENSATENDIKTWIKNNL
ncbi:flavodoxin [bacterium]|nr:flavodoxin [bacterium]